MSKAAEHPETLSSMENLAWMYKNLNRLGEAEELEVQVSKRGKEPYEQSIQTRWLAWAIWQSH